MAFKYRKNQKVYCKPKKYGRIFSAIVSTRHRDGTITIISQYYVDDRGVEDDKFLGDVYPRLDDFWISTDLKELMS